MTTRNESMKKFWENLSPERKAAQVKAMVEGRRRAKRRRSLAQQTGSVKPKNKPTVFEMSGKAHELLVLAGSRENVTRLLDLAELADEVETTLTR